MRLLLDTNMLLWFLDGSDRLTEEAASQIANADQCFVSSISVWEIVTKMTIGKLNLTVPIEHLVEVELVKHGFERLQFDWSHGAQVARLPLLHRDPFDRALVAQAVGEGLTLLTGDRRLADYGSFVIVG